MPDVFKTPHPKAKRSVATPFRISKDVKSILCNTLKWDLKDGTFALRVPATKQNKPLTDYLWKLGSPMGQYDHVQRGLTAWQWRLKLGEHRSLLKYAKEIE